MPLTLPEGAPSSDYISIYLPEVGWTLDRFESYSFDDDWSVPCSGFHFVVGGKENPPDQIMAGLVPGAQVLLKINGQTQDFGFIDSVIPHAGRSGGKRWTVTGRNAFAPVVSGGADPFDPGLRLTATQTLDDLVAAVFGRYGFIAYAIDDNANLAIKTGLQKQRFTKKGKPLKKFTYGQQLKPQPAEGSFAYVEKIINRAGFFIRCSADGKTVIVTTPNYTDPPIARIVRHLSDNVSNVIEGGIGCSTEHQPSLIIATGFAGGGEWPKSAIKAAMVNELVGFDPALLGSSNGTFNKLSASAYANGVGGYMPPSGNKDAKVVAPRNLFPPPLFRPLPSPRCLFLHDQDARSQSQLENFVRLHMSNAQQHMWSGEYLMRGHTYFNGNHSIPWTVNTIVDVDDVDSGPPGSNQGFTNPMWIKGRTFEKSRHGTFTRLRVILPHTLALFPQETDDPSNIQKAGSTPDELYSFGVSTLRK